MHGFWQQRPEIPVVSGRAQVGARVALHGFVQIGEFQWVAEEEHGRVVAHQIPVAFFGVKLDGETTDVALGIGRAAFTCHGRETHKQIGFFADLVENFGFGVLADVVGNGKRTECTRTFGMHAALRNDFTVEVRQFFD